MRIFLPLLFSSISPMCVAFSSVEPCDSLEEAKAIAESETLGEAVTARRIMQTDGTKGWEVLVHMPGQERGWRCIVDRDLAKVRWKEAIKNPPSKVCKGKAANRA